MGEIIALHQPATAPAYPGAVMETRFIPHSSVSQVRREVPGSNADLAAQARAVSERLRIEKALAIRLPKAADEVAPSGLIALRSLTERSTGCALRQLTYEACESMLADHALASLLPFLSNVPGGVPKQDPLRLLVNPHCSGQNVIGLRIQNVILFQTALDSLETQLNAELPLVTLASDGARLPERLAIEAVYRVHGVAYTPQSNVIDGPW